MIVRLTLCRLNNRHRHRHRRCHHLVADIVSLSKELAVHRRTIVPGGLFRREKESLDAKRLLHRGPVARCTTRARRRMTVRLESSIFYQAA